MLQIPDVDAGELGKRVVAVLEYDDMFYSIKDLCCGRVGNVRLSIPSVLLSNRACMGMRLGKTSTESRAVHNKLRP